MTVKEVLESKECKEILSRMIENYKNRGNGVALKKGEHLRRTAFDGLIDKGVFEPEKLIDEFCRVDTGISDLSRSQRQAVVMIVLDAAKKAHRRLSPKEYKNESLHYGTINSYATKIQSNNPEL